MSRSIARAKPPARESRNGGDAARIAPILRVGLAVAGTLVLAFALSRRYSRHLVMGNSMSPALQEGDWIIVDRKAYCGRAPRRGDIVLARDPRQPERELVKRVDHIDLHGAAWLLGDNANASTDSRTFGAVQHDAMVGRVVLRYWPPRRNPNAGAPKTRPDADRAPARRLSIRRRPLTGPET